MKLYAYVYVIRSSHIWSYTEVYESEAQALDIKLRSPSICN